MAGVGRRSPPPSETDSEQSSPVAKKSKFNEEVASTSGASRIASGWYTDTADLLSVWVEEAYAEKERATSSKETTSATTTETATTSGTATTAVATTTTTTTTRTKAVVTPRTAALLAPIAHSTRNRMIEAQEDALSLPMVDRGYYEELEQIGTGAYGIVYKARDTSNGQLVALKKIRLPYSDNGLPPYIMREVSALKHLNAFDHPRVVKLLDVCQGREDRHTASNGRVLRPSERNLTLWLVFEHIEQDLGSFILERHSRKIPPPLVKQMFKEILSGVDFLHSHRMMHRDLKPQNLLVTSDGHIKIADFGLAKIYNCNMGLTTLVVTLWYRAPEIILSAPYATPIDIWSVGCILAELVELHPLFPGNSEGDQLNRIFRLIGRPRREEWPENAPLTYETFKPRHSKPMKTVIPTLCDSGLDLIQQMLVFDPLKRLTAAQALTHPYFTDNEF